jgi:hypothetical protein
MSGTTVEFVVSASSPVYLVFYKGQWANEMGGAVADGSGAVVFTLEHMEEYIGGDTIAVVEPPCPTCLQPAGFRVEDQFPHSVTIAWDIEPGQWAWLVRLDGDTATVTEYGASHTFENLQPHTRYTALVATYCAEGDTSHFSQFQFVTACPEDGCDVDIVMHDAYFDGWTGNAIECYLDGELILHATLDCQSGEHIPFSSQYACYEDTATIDYCTGEELALVWRSGYFSNEATFTVTVGNVPRVSGTGSDYQDGDTIYVVHACPNCIVPSNLVVSNITGSTADIAWTPQGNATTWSVTIGGGIATTRVYVDEPHYHATGLTTFADYTVEIRAHCYDGDSSYALVGAFHTGMCDDGTVVVNFDSSMSSAYHNNFPLGPSNYCNSMVQMIVDAELLSEAHNIMAMAYYTRDGRGGDMYNAVDVYMANVDEDLFYDRFLLPDSAHEFVHVIDHANLGYSSGGWHVVYFDTAFVWDGASNLLVTVVRNNGAWESGSQFMGHDCSMGKSCIAQSDTYTFDINSQPLSALFSTAAVMGDLLFYSCEPDSWCEPPAIVSVEPATHSLTVGFSSAADAVEVAVMQGEWVTPAAGIPVTGDTYTFEGLQPYTAYAVGVRAICAEGLASDWTVSTLSTIDANCQPPTGFYVDNLTEVGNATFHWTVVDGTPNEWNIAIANAEGEAVQTVNVAGTLSQHSVGGLIAGEEYTARIRALCDYGSSEWSNSIVFTAGQCPPVLNVVLKKVNPTTIQVSWTNASEHNVYMIDYGPQGHVPGSGTLQTAYSYVSTIYNLQPDSTYDIYIRAECFDHSVLPWSGPYTLSLVGIGGTDADHVALHPNPTAGRVTLEGLDGGSRVEVLDISGRILEVCTTAESRLLLDLGSLPTGTYFVRITCDRFTATKKIVKQ